MHKNGHLVMRIMNRMWQPKIGKSVPYDLGTRLLVLQNRSKRKKEPLFIAPPTIDDFIDYSKCECHKVQGTCHHCGRAIEEYELAKEQYLGKDGNLVEKGDRVSDSSETLALSPIVKDFLRSAQMECTFIPLPKAY